MQMSDILNPAAVRLMPQLSSKKRLFQEIGEIAASVYDLQAGQILDALQERESLGPTGVGNGVALPHARLFGLKHVVGVFLKVNKPLSFDAVDRQPVDLIFALLAPKTGGVDHLKALAVVSRTLRESNLRTKLRANDDPVTLHAILTEAVAAKVA